MTPSFNGLIAKVNVFQRTCATQEPALEPALEPAAKLMIPLPPRNSLLPMPLVPRTNAPMIRPM